MAVPILAIVGRPNVGKSTLFNRLIRKRKAIVDDMPGVTRDRNYGSCTWQGREILLIDTGGLDTGLEEGLYSKVHEQALVAVEEADLIIFMLDGMDGILPADEELFLMLRKGNKPLLCAINKVDNKRIASHLPDFYALGIEKFFPVSASHGTGVEDLMDQVVESFSHKKGTVDDTQRQRIAIIGRPNVGKSSLLNKILRRERSLVSEQPGTTRDCIDTPFNYNHRSYLIIDTAGIRRKKKVKHGLERLTVIKTLRNIADCQAAIFMIDAVQGITEQDVRIAGYASDSGRAIVIVVNKWDAVEKDEKSIKKYEEDFRFRLKYLNYAPMIFVSAKTGLRVYGIFALVERVMDQYGMRITTGKLNRVVEKAVSDFPPSLHRGKRIKFYYHTQIGTQPPTILFFVNHPEGIHFSYKRYLQNQIREKLGLDSTPLHLIFRAKEKGS